MFFALFYSVSKMILMTCKAEVYLEPNRESMIECFCENTVNYFRKNAPTQMFDWVLNTPQRRSLLNYLEY